VAALYVDNHAKEVWSSLFTQSGKVSNLNRVMPCITTTYVHTGAGTPLVAAVKSGAAPLAPQLVELVKEIEKRLGEEGEVKRAVVIDAEGSTFDILETFAREGRVIVTPLKPSRAPGLELTYSPGSYYRPYREKDHLRVASAVLTQKSTGRRLELGALLVRREHRESDTVLLTTGLELGMQGRDLADLYFERWPLQENFFKAQAAVGLDEHRGNSGRIVTNLAVATELERLESGMRRDEEELARLASQRQPLSQELEELQARVAKSAERRAHLEPQRNIRQLDVALDSVLTAAKLTLALLITFVLREYFSSRPMMPYTFMSRIFGIKGRRVSRPGEEQIVFYENPRDPEMNQALAEACHELNKRNLIRHGRRLLYSTEPPK